MPTAIFPGTFDPPTLGHLNVIQRAAPLFDRLYIAVGINKAKHESIFSQEERVEFLKKLTRSYTNIEVVSFNELLVTFAKKINCRVILRSFRSFTDVEYELYQSEMNRKMEDVETLFMMADEKYRFISSSLIREIASHGRRLNLFVPAEIEDEIFARLQR